MEIPPSEFHEMLSPRCTVLISTVDSEGTPNAAPFSFVTPVSTNPPLLLFAAAPARHTLANVRETGEFVLNIVPEKFLEKLWICSKSFPKGMDEIEQAGFTRRKSRLATPPSIQECAGWIECRLEFEQEAGDHVLVIGRVLSVQGNDEYANEGRYDLSKARPLMHVRGRKFVPAERMVIVPVD